MRISGACSSCVCKAIRSKKLPRRVATAYALSAAAWIKLKNIFSSAIRSKPAPEAVSGFDIMVPPQSAHTPIPPEARDLERVVDSFEQAWQSWTPPPIDQFLPPRTADPGPAITSARRGLLEELIKIDLEYRWRRRTTGGASTEAPISGEHDETSKLGSVDSSSKGPLLEEHLSRYPELGSLQQVPVDLVAEEYRVRRQWGDQPGHAEYRARFPKHDAKLLDEALARVDVEFDREEMHRQRAQPLLIDSPATLRSPSGVAV